MNVIFYHEPEDSVIIGWEEGLKDCGVGYFVSQPKSAINHPGVYTREPASFDLYILENPTEAELQTVSVLVKPHAKYVCIVGDKYKKYFKNFPFVNLWVEPCFYDKATEKSFADDALPFYYCPLAAQESLIPFHTELNREFDLSVDDPLKEDWNIVVIQKDVPPEIIYGNTKVNLNYQRPRKDFVYLNQKAFDIPMSGNFELSTIPQVVEIFEAKVGYTAENEMKEKIQYYIDNDELRNRSAIKAYEVVIRDHTYTVRMDKLLKKLNTI